MSNKRKSAVQAESSTTPKRKRGEELINADLTIHGGSSPSYSLKASFRGIGGGCGGSKRQQPRNDPIFGQKFAFPGLEDESESGAVTNEGDPTDGLKYLRNVRSEARKLPAIMVAKKKGVARVLRAAEEEEEEKAGRTRGDVMTSSSQDEAVIDYDEGTYFDGIWVAPPAGITKPYNGYGHEDAQAYEEEEEEEEELDVQEQCYASLCSGFTRLRTVLTTTPPAEVIQSLDENHPIYFPVRNKNARREWKRLMGSTDPQMAQMACMDMESVLGILQIATGMMAGVVKSGDLPAVMRLGAWIWGALGRCREVGQLSSDEVSQIRELGKVARKMLDWVKDWEQNCGGDQYDVEEQEQDQGGYDDGDEVESDLESIYLPDNLLDRAESKGKANDEEELQAAKARLQARFNASQGEDNQAAGDDDDEHYIDDDYQDEEYPDDTEWSYASRAMIDMILTVAGEFFGQRDLLEARDIWDEQD
ncbi:hypothetical protein KEM54_004987 [Ascosphaera aggregata]|nr:hypothetical protein KEM54_004987 [Ascosphaera aggregata]